MYHRFSQLIMSLLLILGLTQCAKTNELSPEGKALLTTLNDAVAQFEYKSDIVQARSLVVESINNGLVNVDSLVVVETITDTGIYQCVAYIYHNQMITFYNAKKGAESPGEFAKVQVRGTPYEALTFLDAVQMNSFEEFLAARSKDIPESDDWWLITFVTKDKENFSAKNYYSK